MSHTILCKNCNTVVAKTPNLICVNCHAYKWEYADKEPGKYGSRYFSGILGITIKNRAAGIAIASIFILIALFLVVIGLAEIGASMANSMSVNGNNPGSISWDILSVHDSTSPINFLGGILMLFGGLLLFNNAFKIILKKSLFNFFLRHSILSNFLYFIFALFFMFIVVDAGHTGSSAKDFKPILTSIIIFLAIFLVFFILKKIFKKTGKKDYWLILPAFAIIISSLAFAGTIFRTHYYNSPEKAAKSFADESVLQIRSSSGLLFAETDKGEYYIASIRPDLVRALDRYNVKIPKIYPVNEEINEGLKIIYSDGRLMYNDVQNELIKFEDVPQMPTPGWTPLVILLLAAIFFILLKTKRNYWSYLAESKNIIVLFGLLNLYILYWFAIAAVGSLNDIFYGIPKSSPYNIIPGALLISVICGIILIATVKNRIQSTAPVAVKRGWIIFFYFVNLAALGGVVALSNKSNGNPGLLWTFVYMLLSAVSCVLILNDQKETT